MQEAITAATAGITTSVLGWIGMWLHVRRRNRNQQQANGDAVAVRRIDSDDTANARLYRMMESRLTLVEARCDDCERREVVLNRRLADLRGRAVRQDIYIERLCDMLREHGIPVPHRPMEGIDDEDDVADNG